MHFSWVCATKEPDWVYKLMAPFQEVGYDEEWNDLSEYDCIKFYDRFEVWGRRAWIIKLKKWCKGVTKWDLWLNFTYWDHKLKRWTCSVAQKKEIAHFYNWETDKDAYPHVRMYFDAAWDPQFQPDGMLRDADQNKLVHDPKEANELKEFMDWLEDWYDKVPDDFYITIIDYHD